MEFQNQQLQQTLNAAQKARQTFLNAQNSPYPQEMRLAEEQVTKIQKRIQHLQNQLGKASADERRQLQEVQQQLNQTLKVIKNTQQVLKHPQNVQTMPPTLH
ncbi:MAG: hypothetical protein AAGU27_18200 [Dehalobacterium sp.]